MSNRKCCNSRQHNYQIKQRYIPTFVHQQIFEDVTSKNIHIRNTPTFYSTALDTEGYNVKTVHIKYQENKNRPATALQKSVYINNTHEKRVQDLNPQNHVFYTSKDRWYDHTKQDILQSIKDCRNHGYSKQRKYVDLSSDPVFTDYIYGTKGNLLANQSSFYQNCSNKRQNQNNLIQKPNLISTQQNRQEHQSQINRQQNQEDKINPNQNQNVQEQQSHNNETDLNTRQKDAKKVTYKNQVPQKGLKLKGKPLNARTQSAHKAKAVSQKPTFTIIRKNRIPHQ